MQPQSGHDVTSLLQAWRGGDRRALEDLIPLLDRELHRIAKHYMDWQDRSHFLAACSAIMRRILVDHARGHQAAKRGGGVRAVPLEEAWAAAAALGISKESIMRDWRLARAWLARELGRETPHGSGAMAKG